MRLQSIFLGEPGPIINRVQGPPPNFIQLGPPGNRRSIEVTAYSANSSPFSQVQGSLFSTFGDPTGKELSSLLPPVATKHKTPEPFRGNQLSTLISQVTDHHLRRTLVETGEKRLVFFFFFSNRLSFLRWDTTSRGDPETRTLTEGSPVITANFSGKRSSLFCPSLLLPEVFSF